ncbi:hypothetical protein [Streptomyces rimosus]|uniref:hypothetical protein n=1 Tax=Streptomyces rimosus TaxID=1927 RepID=UPI000B183D33|nr:hypothetical protein [Streptomyces rimosus]
MKSNTLRIAATTALAAVTLGLAGPAANAVTHRPAPAAVSAVPDVSDAAAIKALERFARAIEDAPDHLQKKNLDDREVVEYLTRVMGDKGSVEATTNGPVLRVNWMGCTIAIAKFAAENGIPVAKVSRIIGKLGGFAKFAKYAWRYIKEGHVPPEAGEEFADFVMAVSGLDGVASACA